MLLTALKMNSAKSDGADLAEIRIDYLESAERGKWRDVLARKCLPVIVTNRADWEGGKWTGDETLRLSILVEAEQLGAEYVDVELAACETYKELRSKSSCADAKLILSHHNFNRGLSLKEIQSITSQMIAAGADIHKIAMMANSALELCPVFESLRDAVVPTIAIAMGEYGQASRVAAGKFGAFLTFASAGTGCESAPGQVSTQRLAEFFGFSRTSPATRLFGIIGNPVSHSMSPALHNAAMEHSGIDGLYVYMPVKENVAEFIRQMCAIGFDGFSVTIPHKVAALDAVDKIDPVARDIGAINTIVRRSNGSLFGCNTDWVAAINAIEESLPSRSLSGKRVICIGAGGAGRALIFGALSRGARQVLIVNRSGDKAVALATDIDTERASGISQEEFNANSDIDFEVVMNTTSVGMHPNLGESPILKSKLVNKPLVFDAVYNPLETKLLREASSMGCATVSGLEMFVGQGAEQFDKWHPGVDPPVEIMRNVVIRSLKS